MMGRSGLAAPARTGGLGSGEPQPLTLDRWLNVPLGGRTSVATTSGVEVHTDTPAALAAFEAAVRSCATDASIVLIAGWDFDEATMLTSTTSVDQALQAAASRGAQVRALFNHFPVINVGALGSFPVWPGSNVRATTFINGLPGGAAIHDRWLLQRNFSFTGAALLNPVQTGIHHQKAWAVWNGEVLRAWCGGVDFNPNRAAGASPHPLHDTQAALTGAAAADLYEILRERWNDNPNRPPAVTMPPPFANLASGPSGTQRARILTTYGDPTAHAGLNGPPYPFAPRGSTAIRDFLRHAIDTAQRFIYVEDQYLVDEDIARRLAAAMSRVKALIMVICHTTPINVELYQAWRRRQRFLSHLTPHAAKVAVVTSSRFIHSKLWVFDDEVALVSSANINRRGMSHDSEVGVAFGDLVVPGEVVRMRRALWATHLGSAAPPPTTPPEATLAVWQHPPAGTNVVPYAPGAGVDREPVPVKVARLFSVDEFWDQIIDPES